MVELVELVSFSVVILFNWFRCMTAVCNSISVQKDGWIFIYSGTSSRKGES
jgi:hypothetical protein